MATKEAVKEQLDKIVEKLEEVGPYVAEDWGGSVQFIFPDLDTAWFLQMAMDGTVESLEEKLDEDAATGIVEMYSDAFLGVYAKTTTTDEARAKGQMRTRKSMEALIKVIAPTL